MAGKVTGIILSVAISVIVLIAIVCLLVYGENAPDVVVRDNNVQVKCMYGLTIDFFDITQISLIDESMSDIGVGRRVNGYGGFGGTLKGHFKSDDLGETLLFVDSNSAPTIRIERNNEKDIYISFNNSEETVLLFNKLTTAATQNMSYKDQTTDITLQRTGLIT
ncbi:MAG: hypothetical protein LBE70_00520 [Nitrososphaerota archaeon]|jgi:hypothetical protein|nr:hypothetical protein [Nitrososphaerota archaeon]